MPYRFLDGSVAVTFTPQTMDADTGLVRMADPALHAEVLALSRELRGYEARGDYARAEGVREQLRLRGADC